jgi:hypothetical protein
MAQAFNGSAELLLIKIGSPATANEDVLFRVGLPPTAKHVPRNGRRERWQDKILEKMPNVPVIDVSVVAQVLHDFSEQLALLTNLLSIHLILLVTRGCHELARRNVSTRSPY